MASDRHFDNEKRLAMLNVPTRPPTVQVVHTTVSLSRPLTIMALVTMALVCFCCLLYMETWIDLKVAEHNIQKVMQALPPH
jgi:hypothetical protein